LVGSLLLEACTRDKIYPMRTRRRGGRVRHLELAFRRGL